MSLGDHLVELRRRLMIAAAALVVGMVVAFFITDPIIQFLLHPIELVAEQLGDDFTRLTYTGATSSFDMRLRIAFAIGLLISAPIWLWQIWAYVMPGLTRREVRYTIGFMATAVPLFFAGCAVGVLILPHMLLVLSSFVPDSDFASQIYEADRYYDLVFKTLIAVGVAFVIPVFLVALNLAGILSGMEILRGWRIAVIVATAFAALATPSADVVSMLLLAAVLVVLYFAAAGVALLFDRARRRREKALETEAS
ncbi:twin-arginine translocase subunit TatC [Microbacterium rhizophilus]|uniref:twin-arginine translocase subunit TatC n=1 Tax=Microbacterium rhizophilus TaxID=3138934 RepID=UPI0031EBA5B1